VSLAVLPVLRHRRRGQQTGQEQGGHDSHQRR
jgi:hypothetical protein